MAALGATFALFVAACAATEAPTSQRSSASAAASTSSAPTAPLRIADAGFLEAAPQAAVCVGGAESRLALLDVSEGHRLWEFPIPRPSGTTTVDGSLAFVGFAWNSDLNPGVVAVDIADRKPLWQRFLEQQPTEIRMVGENLIVATSRSVRALSPETGEDLWVAGPDSDVIDIVFNDSMALLLSISGVTSLDLATGDVLWVYPLVRPDAIATSNETMAVAVDTTLFAVDLAERVTLWQRDVERRGADSIWVGANGSVVVELAPSADPAGALAGLDRDTGFERWRVSGAGEAIWPNDQTLVVSSIVERAEHGQPYELLAVDVVSGEIRWSMASAQTSSEAVLGADNGRVILVGPHATRSESVRVQLIDAEAGTTIVDASTTETFDGATAVGTSFIAVHRTFDRFEGDRGYAGLILGPDSSWAAPFSDGVQQTPQLTPFGVLAISGEMQPRCIARTLNEPRNIVPAAG